MASCTPDGPLSPAANQEGELAAKSTVDTCHSIPDLRNAVLGSTMGLVSLTRQPSQDPKGRVAGPLGFGSAVEVAPCGAA